MVSSVSLGHAVTNPEGQGGESSPASGDPRVPDHLLDGLTHETRGIANRLIFRSRFDTREMKILSEGVGVGAYLTTKTRSSTP